jgi:tape measure domain-containing protein
MAGISTSVSVRDNLSASFATMTQSINVCLGAFMDMQAATSTSVNTAAIEAARGALQNMNVAADEVTRSIDAAGQEQRNYNDEVRQGVVASNGLLDKVKGLVGAYLGLRAVGSIVDISDTMASNTARLNLMNDGLQTTEQLEQMIFGAAQRSRGEFIAMEASVAKLGNLAGDSFSSSAQIVSFLEQTNKLLKISGANTEESSAAMLQLTQSMAKGVLNGDELTSIMENGSMLAKTIADYMGVSTGEMKAMAAEGQVTSDVILSAILGATEQTNAAFESIPMTWGDVMTGIKNNAISAFDPVLDKINQIANGDRFDSFASGAVGTMTMAASVIGSAFSFIVNVGAMLYDNWSMIGPIFYGVATALALYNGVLLAYNVYQGISNALAMAAAVAAVAHGSMTAAEAAATTGATAAQIGFNAALYACPLTWILVIIIAVVAAIYVVIGVINKVTGQSISATGVICGGINVVLQFFKNLGLGVANVALGIWNVMGAVAGNIPIAFHNACLGAQSAFYSLASVAIGVILKIANALNSLPFIEFDTSGLEAAADNYASKAADAAGSKQEYNSVSEAWNKGMGTFDAFSSGWVGDAYSSGYSFGEGIADEVKGVFNGGDAFGTDLGAMASDVAGIGNAAGSAADSAGKIADSVEITEENLAWMKDIAEREVIDRTVFSQVTVDMSGMTNKVENLADLDSIPDYINDILQEQISVSAEGV